VPRKSLSYGFVPCSRASRSRHGTAPHAIHAIIDWAMATWEASISNALAADCCGQDSSKAEIDRHVNHLLSLVQHE
jgi:hypothetical protein